MLTQNYRSHSGITNIAGSILRLLSFLFPLSFDKIAEERALYDGPLPVLLKSSGASDLFLSLFGRPDKAQGIEFGADQVILVRDQRGKDAITELFFGDQALVMTIQEAKGLEFNDVLLFNFFHDSPAENGWRSVYQFMVEDLKVKHCSFPRHCNRLLSSELKHLYTAVTRFLFSPFLFFLCDKIALSSND